MTSRESTTPSMVPIGHCTPLASDPINEPQAIAVAAIFKALADPTRLRLVSIVAASANGEACACDLPALVGKSQPTVSHHLSQLTDVCILLREQRGKWAWFSINPATLRDLCVFLTPTC